MQSSMQKRLKMANYMMWLEVHRDEREAGGWWEDGFWVDVVRGIGKADMRYVPS